MLNSELDLAHFREVLKTRGRVQIDAILQPHSAERLHQCLQHEVPWSLAHKFQAQATRYRPGHFLKHHDDYHSTEGRLYAYVLNLSRQWHPDWGGLLQFLDSGDGVVDTLLPRWNTLSLFRVPALHCVSLVAPWAREPRLAITGWFLL